MISRRTKRRIAAGIGANAFGQLVTIVTQLVSLPIFLSCWDVSRYGVWLMLSAVPLYFTMADVGIVNAARNDMTMALGAGNVRQANQVFQTTLSFILAVALGVALILGLVMTGLVSFGSVEKEYAVALYLLVLVVILSFFNGLAEAIFCSVGMYGFGTALGHCIRLLEWSGGIIGLFATGRFDFVALGMLLCRALGVVLAISLSKKHAKQYQWGVRQARLDQFKTIMKPALYFLVFPLSNALSLQGFTLLVGSTLGAASVTVFNTYRTLARVIVQATQSLSFSVGPEMSRLYGAGQIDEYLHLFRKSQFLNLGLVVVTSAMMALVGPYLLEWWTHDRIHYDSMLLWAMLIYATVVGLGHVPKTFLMSINKHSRIAMMSVLVYSAALVLAYALRNFNGMIGNTIIMTIAELILVLQAIYLSKFEIRFPVLVRAEGSS